jgi:hypothetical protein
MCVLFLCLLLFGFQEWKQFFVCKEDNNQNKQEIGVEGINHDKFELGGKTKDQVLWTE